MRQNLPTCGAKVDIFSLGIIAVELWQPFPTQMERHITLEACRAGILPERLIRDSPAACNLIQSLLSVDPSDRPSALQVQLSVLQQCFCFQN